MPRQIASKWRQRFYLQRLPGLDDHPRGRAAVGFSPGVVVAIEALARDPHFVQKARRILDLYQRRRKAPVLGLQDYVLCVDKKTSIQARAPMAFQARHQRAARPFKWTFIRRDLHALLRKLKRVRQ